jgi:DNA-binding SARP family transcriptional activator/Tfp pilus assembly protein PilF
MLRLHTLGAFELQAGDPPAQRLVPTQPKRLALLSYLALAVPRGFHRRDTLLALFWPELSGEEARRALRQALHHLRKAVGESAIEARSDDQVRLREGALWCDALAFEAAVAGERHDEALALYRNAFLAGVHLPEVSVELEEWIEQTRRRLHQMAADSAAAVSLRAERGGDLAQAVEAARTAHDLEPEDEAGARRLMDLLERSGDRAKALQVYDRLARRLESEYQTKPSPETAALARSLREVPALESTSSLPLYRSTPVPPDGPSAIPPVRHSAVPPFRRSAHAALAVAVLAVLAVFAVKQSHSTARLPAGPPSRLIVSDFENYGSDSLLAGVLTAALRLELSQSPLVEVMKPAAIQSARRRLQDPAPAAALSDTMAHLLAAREGVRLVVRGGLAGDGRQWIVSAQLLDAATGRQLATVHETAADSSHLLETIDQVARGIRERLGESARALRSAPPLRQLTTSSLPALQHWTEAQAVLDLAGDRPKARRLLEEAVALDSGFAMAWRSLSVIYGSLGPAAAQVHAATQAYRYRDRLTDRERHLVDAEYYVNVTQDFGKAFAAYDSQLVATPADAGILGAIGWLHFRLRQFDDAERFYSRALQADSTLTALYFGRIESLINLGRLEPARAAVRKFKAEFPANPFDHWEQIYLAVAAGQYDSVEAHARALLAAAPDDADHRGEAVRTLANLALLRGKLTESARLRREAMSAYEVNGDFAGYLLEALALATGEAVLGHRPEAARKEMAEALRRHPLDSLPPGDRPYVPLGVFYANLGDLDRAAEMQASLERLGLNQGRFKDGPWHQLRGSILLARHRYVEAEEELRLAAEREECAICSLPALARGYDLADRADSAVAVYRRYLSTPWMKRLELDATELGPICLRLGELYKSRGERGDAVEMYRRVAGLWEDGDAGLRRVRERVGEE